MKPAGKCCASTLVLNQRMARALGYVLDKAYLRNIQFQRYTREKSLGRRKSVK